MTLLSFLVALLGLLLSGGSSLLAFLTGLVRGA